MASYPVTVVRHDEVEAQGILRVFVFGGHFGTDRPPRGIDSAHLLDFIVRHVPVSGESDVYLKVLHALRFYELGEAVPHLLQTLDQPVVGREGVQRCCYAIQAAADVGSPTAELMARLCRFFDEALVPHPETPGLWPLLMETRVVLAPYGSDAALEQRLAAEVLAAKAHERDGEAEMMAYDKVAAVQRNDLPRAQRRSAMKVALRTETDEDVRRRGLVEAYLGRRYLGTLLEEWAGRWLRWEAFGVRPEPVWQVLAQAIDAIDRSKLSPAQADLELVRAAQAILYLGGTLSLDHQLQYEAARGVANFLWDDPK
jgi:hypothetical protein